MHEVENTDPDAGIPAESVAEIPSPTPTSAATADIGEVIDMATFISQFGDGLLESVKLLNPPVYSGVGDPKRDLAMSQLTRKPFEAQGHVVQAACALMFDRNDPACIINAEMGTGKTMMAIAVAALAHAEGLTRTLVISPPHLVYKWRREIKETVPGARVWILNGPDTLRKLIQIRQMQGKPSVPEFFILGRVRMRMGFNWVPAIGIRKVREEVETGEYRINRYACCPDCGKLLTDESGDGPAFPISPERARLQLSEVRSYCSKKACGAALWTLVHRGHVARSQRDMVQDALIQMPTIGPKTAASLIDKFGDEMLAGMLGDNLYEFLNLMDEDGDLVFSDRQATRMERALATFEFSIGQGGYQPTEFIKRYLPQGYFGLLVVDEGHEYKNDGTAQGQAMGVLARKCRKTLLLTGTLMGGYADDLFHLLWRINPNAMLEDGFKPNHRGGMGGASMAFMREHGVLKDVYKESEKTSLRTANARTMTHRVAKGPGFGPKGIMRFVLPCTVFLKLKDIGGNVLPPYKEVFTEVPMTEAQSAAYRPMQFKLSSALRSAMAKGDTSLLGVVLNVLLAWPDCAFRSELVRHPHTRAEILSQPAVFSDNDVSPKEQAILDLCLAQKALRRKVLVYAIYTGTRDITSRLKMLLEANGLKTAVLRASVQAVKREDWVAEQVDRGIDVLLTNPELVKTGLDLLDFPTIAFMQTGYNVYTLQQAARRSWRIGQKEPVEVHFLGYAGSAQMQCLELMAAKIAVSQSTSGDMPDSGLDVLNQSGDSIEVALAKKLIQ